MDARHRPLLRFTSCVVLAAQCAAALPAWSAVAPAKPAPVTTPAPVTRKPVAPVDAAALLTRAQGFYRDGRYDEALGQLAGPIARKELSGDALREARIVLARCYVKKGMTPRAKEHFGALLAAEPAFVLDAKHADAEELAVFAQVKGVPSTPAPVAAAPPGIPGKNAGAPNEKPAKPKPDLGLPSSSASSGRPGWLARNKYV
ncbi:MAG: tetratricopeptide repeat protein, partial [Candidatus Eisenbacteria bacterium]